MSDFSLINVFCACGTQDKMDTIAARLADAGMKGQQVDHNGLTVNGLMNDSVKAELESLQAEGLVHSFELQVTKKQELVKKVQSASMFGQQPHSAPRDRLLG